MIMDYNIKLNNATGDIYVTHYSAAALENKHSGLLFKVVMLLYTSSEDLVISPYSEVCMYLMALPTFA